jgi:glycosyltransferase involved in cell wall biosynthesis
MVSAARRVHPEVSVVIPTRNRRHYVIETIESARRQDDVAVEVVVVDDGSTDGTRDAVSAVDGVRVIRHQIASGVAAARNAGIRAAAGAWVAFLDDDDLWAPWKLRRQLDAARASAAPWAYGAALVVDELDQVVRMDEAPSPDVIAEALRRYNAVPAGASNVIVRRDLLDAAGGFDPALHHLADWDLWLRLTAAHRPARSTEPLVAYLRHPANMHVSEIRSSRREIDYLADKVARTLGWRLDDTLLARWLAEGYSRGGRPWRAAAILASAGEVARCIGIRRPVSVERSLAPAWAQRKARSGITLPGEVVHAERPCG